MTAMDVIKPALALLFIASLIILPITVGALIKTSNSFTAWAKKSYKILAMLFIILFILSVTSVIMGMMKDSPTALNAIGVFTAMLCLVMLSSSGSIIEKEILAQHQNP